MFGVSLPAKLPSIDTTVLIIGAIAVGAFLLFGQGARYGASKEIAKNEHAYVIATEETAKSQTVINESVQKVETKARVRRAKIEKKVADAVAQIQNPNLEADPVLVWASTIDGLRHDLPASNSAPIDGGSIGRHSGAVRQDA